MDPAPAEFADVNHTVHTADIDKCTIAGQGLDNTVVFLAYFHFIPELFNTLTAFGLGNTANRTDNTFSGTVNLCNTQADRFVQQLGKFRFPRQIGLAGRDKNTNAVNVYHNAALIFFNDGTFQNCIAVNSFFYIDPCFCGVKTSF